MTHARSGFSLMELMIYIGIVGMAMAGFYGMYTYITGQRARTQTQQSLMMVKAAIDQYYVRKDEYPERLQALIPTYLDKIPKDGWDNKLYYKATPGAKKPYRLESYGSQGPGGEGKRISVWD